MVDDNYKGAETDKEAISDWGGGGGGGVGKKQNKYSSTANQESRKSHANH